MPESPGQYKHVNPFLIALAMGSLYFFWGSTYLGIKWAVQGYPPFFMAAARNMIAGVLIYGFMRARGAPRPSRRDWKNSVIIGALLLLGGNGLVTYASQFMPSGLLAVLVAMLPLWMVLLDRSSPRSMPVLAGVAFGFCGVVLLVAPKVLGAIEHLRDPGSDSVQQGIGALCTVLSSLSWACGSLYSRRVSRSGPPAMAFRSTGMQLMCGGALLALVSTIRGEPFHMSTGTVFASSRPTLALAYLIVFGSLVGYSSYIWLLGVIPASRVSTYAYVNPVIAVVLGWLIGGEVLSARTMLAAGIIIASVAVIVSVRPRGARASAPAPAKHNPCQQECAQ